MLSPTVLLEQATVLLVDDEECLRRHLSRVLQADGFRVLAAGDGLDALCVLRQSRFAIHLVITDVCMPRMSGFELAAHMAAEPCPPPVLFISGGHPGSDAPGPFLQKPFRAQELITRVRALLSGRIGQDLVLVDGAA